MADALCGPSNALQSFQKHTTVDRTLQQDRLVGRQSPAQGFRSPPGSHAGALDSEFDAFQAGRPAPPQDFQYFGPRFEQPPPQFAQATQAPDWAADFQRLNVSSPPPQAFQQQRPQAANAASAWHQDFLRQQAPVAQAPAMQQNTYGGMPGYNMGGFGGQAYMQTPSFQDAQMSETAQGKQRAQEDIPAFDEAAFEQAFAQVQQDMMEVVETEQVQQAHAEVLDLDRPGEMDPLLQRIRETRPAVYTAIQVWSETGLGRTEEAVAYLENMAHLEKSGTLVQDANEGKWIVDSLQRIANRDAPEEVQTKAEELIKAINQRLMSQYPLGTHIPMSEEPIWQDLEDAGYMQSPEPERVDQKPEEQKQEEPKGHDDDEMAATAGRLLERVADNTSEKFQNSQFLGLMRRLRDREVKVQEDKIVAVEQPAVSESRPKPKTRLSDYHDQLMQLERDNVARLRRAREEAAADPTISQTHALQDWQIQSKQLRQQNKERLRQARTERAPDDPARVGIPSVDPTILNYAAHDFETPVYSDAGHEQGGHEQYVQSQSTSPITGEQLLTDEISDQYRYYNVNAAYHR